MERTTKTAAAHKSRPAGTFNMRMGKTTYVIGVHFSQTSRDTLEDKVKRLMRDEVKAANSKDQLGRGQRVFGGR